MILLYILRIQVKGYRAKVLAVRSSTNMVQKLFNIHYFWLFTMMGLTVPYRIRFGKNCDELRVAVVKEVSSRIKVESDSLAATKSSWFASPRSWLWGPATAQDLIKQRRENFRLKMQEMSLYKSSTENDVLVGNGNEYDISDRSSDGASPLGIEKNGTITSSESKAIVPLVQESNATQRMDLSRDAEKEQHDI